MRDLHWPTYWEDYVLGTRKYILKEENTSLPQARRNLQRFVSSSLKFIQLIPVSPQIVLYKQNCGIRADVWCLAVIHDEKSSGPSDVVLFYIFRDASLQYFEWDSSAPFLTLDNNHHHALSSHFLFKVNQKKRLTRVLFNRESHCLLLFLSYNHHPQHIHQHHLQPFNCRNKYY